MSIQLVLQYILGGIMILVGILAVSSKKVINAVIYMSLLSLLAVVGFVLMNAPDVAVTEAVIGSGLVTFLFVFTILGVKKSSATQEPSLDDLDIHGQTVLGEKELVAESEKGSENI